jgi:glucan phosphoethanolaminetransferase (alkaline phosphatase superfamily)
MIQRLQSLYLLLTTLLSFLFLKDGFIAFSDEPGSVINFTIATISVESETLMKTLPVTLLIIIIPLLSLITIFLFKNRRLQVILCKTLLILVSAFIIVLVFYSYTVINRYNAELIPGIRMTVPVIQLVLVFMAYRGIKKDDDLVKSYDRLR